MERTPPITPEEYTRRTGKKYTYLSKFQCNIEEPLKWYEKPIAFGVTAMELIECVVLVAFTSATILVLGLIL